MQNETLRFSFTVDQTPAEVFAAINNVDKWWSGTIEGDACGPGSTFTYRYGDVHHSVQRVTEFVPGTRIVWHVDDSNLSFITNHSEWKGTDIIFDIGEESGKTLLRFTHDGLTPESECYDACSSGWSMLVNRNLKNLIQTGNAQPDAFTA